MVKIEKNVPVPSGCASKLKYPWREMEVGDMFRMPLSHRRTLATSASRYSQLLGRKFIVRTLENEVGIWRIK